MVPPIGILGLGMALPAHIRRNDFWAPEALAASPQSKMRMPTGPLTPGMTAVVNAMKQLARDPSQGTVQRHVLGETETLLDLEERAARIAIERAHVSFESIDLILTNRTPTEHQLTNAACDLHHRLGLPVRSFALQVEGAQHSFLLQLSMARAMIAAGQATTALLVQSSAISRLLDYSDVFSLAFGDGATAAVVGGVEAGHGLLATTHYTDGEKPHTLVASVPGASWYSEGRAVFHLRDLDGMASIILRTVDLTATSIADALAAAGVRPDQVDVLAMHQGMPWLRKLVQEHTGLTHTRAVDTFSTTGHLFGAFVPSTLVAAERDGVLSDGDVVVIAGGGNGMTYGAAVLRWGRG